MNNVPPYFRVKLPCLDGLVREFDLVYVGAFRAPYDPNKVRLFPDLKPLYPSNPHDVFFENSIRYVYESPRCQAQLSFNWD